MKLIKHQPVFPKLTSKYTLMPFGLPFNPESTRKLNQEKVHELKCYCRIAPPANVCIEQIKNNRAFSYSPNVLAILDTGSTVTTICTEIAETLSLPIVGEHIMKGINVQIPTKFVEGILFDDNNTLEFPIQMQFATADFKSQDVKVIIGMDIIRLGVLHIDMANDSFTFTI